MMYVVRTQTIGMPMMYAIVQKRVLIWEVPLGTLDDIIK